MYGVDPAGGAEYVERCTMYGVDPAGGVSIYPRWWRVDISRRRLPAKVAPKRIEILRICIQPKAIQNGNDAATGLAERGALDEERPPDQVRLMRLGHRPELLVGDRGRPNGLADQIVISQ